MSHYHKPDGHRTKKVVVRLTPSEAKRLEAERRASKLTRSAFTRAKLFSTI